MRFVTYDRGGQRRLGAIFEGEVVDLPDAVGHPAFPTTLEGLVSSSRGTVMDAARTALDRDDVFDWRVKRPRVLTPLFPASLLSPGSLDVERRVIGPEQEVPWPDGAAWLEYEPKVAAVLGLETSASEPFDRVVFSETLPVGNFRSWIFKHDVVEACTAVKGPFLDQACASGVDAVIYLDPDTALFETLEPIERWLETDDILLTPHLIDPNDEPAAIFDNDLPAAAQAARDLRKVIGALN